MCYWLCYVHTCGSLVQIFCEILIWRNHKLKKLNLNKMWKQTFFQDFSNFSKKWKIRRLHPPKLQQCQVDMNLRRLTSLVLGSDLRFTHQFWLLSASLSKHLGSLMKFRDKIDRFVAKSGLCHILRAQFTVSHLTKYSKNCIIILILQYS